MSDESIKPPSTSKKMPNPSVDYVGTKAREKFNGDWLKQEKNIFNHGKIVDIYIVFEIERGVTYILDVVSNLVEKGIIQLVMKFVEI